VVFIVLFNCRVCALVCQVAWPGTAKDLLRLSHQSATYITTQALKGSELARPNHSTNGGRPLWWWVDPACRDRNDHQPHGSFYVSDTSLFTVFSHKWHIFYSGWLLICIISKWL